MKRRDWILVAVSILIGFVIAWIDTRPGWDDTGIEVGLILLSSAGCGILSPRFAWLWALSIGVWTPLANALAHHGFASSITLVFAFVGAYAGAFIGKSIKSLSS